MSLHLICRKDKTNPLETTCVHLQFILYLHLPFNAAADSDGGDDAVVGIHAVIVCKSVCGEILCILQVFGFLRLCSCDHFAVCRGNSLLDSCLRN